MTTPCFDATLTFDPLDIDGRACFDTVTLGGGTDNYNDLVNKPSIDGTVLVGDKSLPEIGVGTVSAQEIDQLIYG